MRGKILTFIIFTLLLPAPSLAKNTAKASRGEKEKAKRIPVVLWRQPDDIRTRNLFFGPGGSAGLPRAPFRFIEEDKGGSSPKFVVTDARGTRWKVKIGKEAKTETAATRLLWAAGYFTDVTYYLSQVRVAGLPKLSRGREFVSPGGLVHSARFEREMKKADDWSWFDNPFVGTREFNGLRVLVALVNNWDLKQSNNAVYNLRGQELRYVVSDLGATFGKTGGDWSRSKGDLEDYLESPFIEEVNPTTVDLVMDSRPPLLYAVAVPYFVKRTRMEKVGEDIPRGHARWIGQWLARLSDAQIRDAFRGAGFAPHEVTAYASKVHQRINQLSRL